MKCPLCGYEETKVIDSRPAENDSTIRRRRECLKCKKRFTTYEVIERLPVLVIKKDKRRENFDRDKLLNGMLRACYKRPVPLESVVTEVDHIEQELNGRMDREVKATEIGEMAMSALLRLDYVAYVRFASVYREFKDVDAFVDEVTKLLNKPKG